MTHPVVSVILATRNRVALLRRAVASVLAQTFDDLELIVVDDGSTDATPQFLATLSDPRIRVLRCDVARGASAARNEGLGVARGEFIAFQDDGDAWVAHKLDTQLATLRAALPDAALCVAARLRWQRQELGGVYLGGPGDALVSASDWLVCKSVLQLAGRFDEQLQSGPDAELASRIGKHGKIVYVEEPLHIEDAVHR